MENLGYVVLPVSLLFIALRAKQDIIEYNEFKKLKSTKSRQRKYKRWVLQSLLIFGAGSMLSLLIIGKLGVLSQPLADFLALLPQPTTASSEESGGFIVGVLSSIIMTGIVMYIISKKGKLSKKNVTIGDIEAMLPRNNSERKWAALLAINAGFSEELFFRALLPVLFFIVLNNAPLSVAFAIIVFGLVHWYQGILGVFFTILMGAALMYTYLKTGNILIAMGLHAAVDLNSLVLQPILRDIFWSRKKT